jgi:hypothetical protein
VNVDHLNRWAAAILNWTPGLWARHGLMAVSLLTVVLIGFAHYAAGPQVEFYALFLVPVITAVRSSPRE